MADPHPHQLQAQQGQTSPQTQTQMQPPGTPAATATPLALAQPLPSLVAGAPSHEHGPGWALYSAAGAGPGAGASPSTAGLTAATPVPTLSAARGAALLSSLGPGASGAPSTGRGDASGSGSGPPSASGHGSASGHVRNASSSGSGAAYAYGGYGAYGAAPPHSRLKRSDLLRLQAEHAAAAASAAAAGSGSGSGAGGGYAYAYVQVPGASERDDDAASSVSAASAASATSAASGYHSAAHTANGGAGGASRPASALYAPPPGGPRSASGHGHASGSGSGSGSGQYAASASGALAAGAMPPPPAAFAGRRAPSSTGHSSHGHGHAYSDAGRTPTGTVAERDKDRGAAAASSGGGGGGRGAALLRRWPSAASSIRSLRSAGGGGGADKAGRRGSGGSIPPASPAGAAPSPTKGGAPNVGTAPSAQAQHAHLMQRGASGGSAASSVGSMYGVPVPYVAPAASSPADAAAGGGGGSGGGGASARARSSVQLDKPPLSPRALQQLELQAQQAAHPGHTRGLRSRIFSRPKSAAQGSGQGHLQQQLPQSAFQGLNNGGAAYSQFGAPDQDAAALYAPAPAPRQRSSTAAASPRLAQAGLPPLNTAVGASASASGTAGGAGGGSGGGGGMRAMFGLRRQSSVSAAGKKAAAAAAAAPAPVPVPAPPSPTRASTSSGSGRERERERQRWADMQSAPNGDSPARAAMQQQQQQRAAAKQQAAQQQQGKKGQSSAPIAGSQVHALAGKGKDKEQDEQSPLSASVLGAPLLMVRSQDAPDQPRGAGAGSGALPPSTLPPGAMMVPAPGQGPAPGVVLGQGPGPRDMPGPPAPTSQPDVLPALMSVSASPPGSSAARFGPRRPSWQDPAEPLLPPQPPFVSAESAAAGAAAAAAAARSARSSPQAVRSVPGSPDPAAAPSSSDADGDFVAPLPLVAAHFRATDGGSMGRHPSVSGLSDSSMITAPLASDQSHSRHGSGSAFEPPQRDRTSTGAQIQALQAGAAPYAQMAASSSSPPLTDSRQPLPWVLSDESLPDLKIGSLSDSGHDRDFQAVFGLSPPVTEAPLPALRRLGATRRSSFLPAAAASSSSLSSSPQPPAAVPLAALMVPSSSGETTTGSHDGASVDAATAAIAAAAASLPNTPGAGGKRASRALTSAYLAGLTPGQRVLAQLEATKPVGLRSVVHAGRSRRVIVRRASWPLDSTSAAKNKAKKSARHKRNKRPPSALGTPALQRSPAAVSASLSYPLDGLSSSSPRMAPVAQSLLANSRGGRPGGSRDGLPSDELSPSNTLQVLSGSPRKSVVKPLGPPPAPSAMAFKRPAVPEAASLPDAGQDAGSDRTGPAQAPVKRRTKPPRSGSALMVRQNSGGGTAEGDSRMAHRRKRGDSTSSIRSTDSAAVGPRTSSLFNPQPDGPIPPRRSDSLHGVSMIDSPSGAGAELQAQPHGSEPTSPRSPRSPLADQSLESSLLMQQTESAPPPESPSSPPPGSERSEKPAIPKRNPMRRYAGSAAASTTTLGMGQPSPAAPSPGTESDMRAASDYLNGSAKQPANDRRISSAGPRTDTEALSRTLKEGNRSQASLNSVTLSSKSAPKKWNPLKDVFSEAEDSGSGFARSLRFRSRKASRAGELVPTYLNGHTRTDSQASGGSSTAFDSPLFEESTAQRSVRLQSMTESRGKVIRELIETEKSYAADMAVVRDIYLARANSRLGFASPGMVASSSASSGMSGTPSFPSSLFNSPPQAALTPNRQRIASSSSYRMSGRIASQDGSVVLGPPFDQTVRSPPLEAADPSNRSSVYTVHSTASDNGTVASHTRPSSATMSNSATQDGFGSTSGSISTHSHDGPMGQSPRPGASPLSAADVRIIFAGVEATAALAADMVQQMQAAVDGGEGAGGSVGQRLASYLIEAAPRMIATYNAYCATHTASISRLQEIMSKGGRAAVFIKETTEIARQHTHAWDLASLLIKPVQRVTKYPLLLKQILKSTDPDADDFDALGRALAEMETLAERINEQKRRQDFLEDMSKAPRTPGGTAKSSKVVKRQHEQLRAIIGAGVDNKSLLLKWQEVLHAEASLLSFNRSVSDWVKSSKRAMDVQARVLESWSELLAKLDEEDSESSERVEHLLSLVHGDLGAHWGRLDDAVQGVLQPFVEAILALLVGPKRAMERHRQLESDYTRYQQLASKSDKKTPDKRLVQSAGEYVSLQVRLSEELPQLLEGMRQLFNIALFLLVNIQADFYQRVQTEISGFQEAVQVTAEPQPQAITQATSPRSETARRLRSGSTVSPLFRRIAMESTGLGQAEGYGFHSPAQRRLSRLPSVDVNSMDPSGGLGLSVVGTPFIDKLSLYSDSVAGSPMFQTHNIAASTTSFQDQSDTFETAASTEELVDGDKQSTPSSRRFYSTMRSKPSNALDGGDAEASGSAMASPAPWLPELPSMPPLRSEPPSPVVQKVLPTSARPEDAGRARPSALLLVPNGDTGAPPAGLSADAIVNMTTISDGPAARGLDAMSSSPISPLLSFKAGEQLQVFSTIHTPSTSSSTVSLGRRGQEPTSDHVLARDEEGNVGWVDRRLLAEA